MLSLGPPPALSLRSVAAFLSNWLSECQVPRSRKHNSISMGDCTVQKGRTDPHRIWRVCVEWSDPREARELIGALFRGSMGSPLK